MLSEAAAHLEESAASLRRVKLPIQLLASTEDRVPSTTNTIPNPDPDPDPTPDPTPNQVLPYPYP